MNILIVGYGNIGKHIYEEFKSLKPFIYDPFIPEYSKKQAKDYDFAFICVPTDCVWDGRCDTSIVEKAVRETEADLIIIKSTIPPGTTDKLIAETKKRIIFSPEHYGVTQHCKADPGFVILGGGRELSAKAAQLYTHVKNGYYDIRFTDSKTAELSKYMLNSFLALKVTFCNEFATLAEKYGIMYPELRELFTMDERVGSSHTFVYPEKPFYDSHCFNKDVPALVHFANGLAPLIRYMGELNMIKKRKHNKLVAPVSIQQAQKKTEKEVLGSANCQHDCAICLIIRDENEYLEEWLHWHIGQGVQHFYIYDHGSKQPVAEFVRSLDVQVFEKVTVIDWSGSHKHAQIDAYNDCLKRFGKNNKWIGFIDADEHVRVKNGQSLPEFLEKYKNHAGLFAIWVVYDANGQREKSNRPLRERFKFPTKIRTGQDMMGKSFVQPSRIHGMNIHNGCTVEGFDVVDEYYRPVKGAQILIDNPTTDLICVDHYYTKSYEEWLEKLKRGSGDANYCRKYEEFFEYNPGMEYCCEEVFPLQEYEVSSKGDSGADGGFSKKYECSICLIIRDENEYLEEWLRWHIGQGVQHFYIYDHGSKYPVAEFVRRLGTRIAEKVTVIDWSGSHENAQPDAYNDCLKRFGNDNRWIGFIDTDEHVRVKTGQSLPSFLDDYLDYAGVFAIWKVYGANGQKQKTNRPLRERFTKLAKISGGIIERMGKVFVQPLLMKDMYIHNGHPVDGYVIVGENKDAVLENYIYKENATTEKICVDHFFTKSYEEWIEKFNRGRCHARHNREYEEFFAYNPEMEYCREDIVLKQEYESSTKIVARKPNQTYYVCAIVKDEHDYIREWVLHNKSIGFDKIVLYDNNSKRPYDAELGDMIQSGFVELRYWGDLSDERQLNAYNDFVRCNNWTKDDYCAFIDPDEFIFFDDDRTVMQFMNLYQEYSGVGLSWRAYNANGRIESPNGKIPTTQAYTTEFEYWEPRIKFIARLTDIDAIFSPHAFCPKEDYPALVTTGYSEILNQSCRYRDYTNGHIKHYITKSWQDWIKRMKRGNITRNLRKVEAFFEFNPDMAHLQEQLTQDLDCSEVVVMIRD